MTTTIISSGVTSSGIVLNAGDTEVIFNGGIAIGTVDNGGSDYVYGVVRGTTVNGGTEFVVSGGVARGTTVNGGTELVYAAGTARGTTVNSGGQEHVRDGGTASGTTVNGGIESDEFGRYVRTIRTVDRWRCRRSGKGLPQ
jgi:autotransporter passenger strand-loop-strand repeat protein